MCIRDSNIIIVGNTNVADEDIINIAEIEKGMNIFAVNDKALEQNIPILPRIQSATLAVSYTHLC